MTVRDRRTGVQGVTLSRVPGIAVRLLLAQTMVLVAGAATTWIVAAIVGPRLFREYLFRSGVAHASAEQVRAEQAYRYATALASIPANQRRPTDQRIAKCYCL